MKLTIECECCGGRIDMKANPKGYIQFRDYLETKQFRYSESDTEIKQGELKEMKIHCDSCGNFIALGMD